MNSGKLQEMIHHDLNEIDGKIHEFYENIDGDTHALIQDIPISEKIEDVRESVQSLATAKPEEHSMAAMRAIASLGALNSQVDYLTARFHLPSVAQKTGQQVANTWNHIQAYLKNVINSISTHLWQLISNLLTVQNWSVSGSTGVNLFGLSGNAEIQITFK